MYELRKKINKIDWCAHIYASLEYFSRWNRTGVTRFHRFSFETRRDFDFDTAFSLILCQERFFQEKLQEIQVCEKVNSHVPKHV